MHSLLEETMVTPADDDTLFELFVLFRVITGLEALSTYQLPTIKSLASDRNAVAEFSGPIELSVFYNQSGQQQNMSFLPKPEDPDGEPLSRGDAVQQTAIEVAEQYFLSHTFETHTKRPDVLVVPNQTTYHIQQTPPYLVIEVKNSTNVDVIRDGIQELLAYLAFMRREERFVFPQESMFGPSLNGLLVIQDLDEDIEVLSPTAQDMPIRIVQASELEALLDGILPHLFERPC